MADVKAILEQLADALPTLPEKMKEVVEESRDLDQRGDDLLQHIQTVRAEAEELFGQIRAAMDEVKTESGQDRTELDAAVEDLKATSDAALKTVEEWTSGPLVTMTESAEAALAAVRDAIREGGEQSRQAKEEFEAALDEVRGTIGEAQKSLAETVNEVVEAETDVLQSRLSEARSRLEEDLGSITETVEGAQETLSSQVSQLLEVTGTLRDALQSDLKTIVEDVVESQTAQVLADMKQRIDAEIHQALDQAVKELSETMGGLGEKVLGAKGESEGARAVLEPLFDDIMEKVDPFKNAIESIKDAASTVGIDF